MHQPWTSGGGGQATDIEIQAKEILRQKERINEILSTATGKPMDEIEKDTDRDIYLTATEAVDYGLVDEVLDPPEEKKKQ